MKLYAGVGFFSPGTRLAFGLILPKLLIALLSKGYAVFVFERVSPLDKFASGAAYRSHLSINKNAYHPMNAKNLDCII